MKYNFSYGEQVLDEIPSIPMLDKDDYEISWQELEPKIEIPQIKEIFTQGEQLDLLDLELEFYSDSLSWVPDGTFVITEDILNQITITGFDSATLTDGTPRTMKITFMGLDFEVEYEVVSSVED